MRTAIKTPFILMTLLVLPFCNLLASDSDSKEPSGWIDNIEKDVKLFWQRTATDL